MDLTKRNRPGKARRNRKPTRKLRAAAAVILTAVVLISVFFSAGKTTFAFAQTAATSDPIAFASDRSIAVSEQTAFVSDPTAATSEPITAVLAKIPSLWKKGNHSDTEKGNGPYTGIELSNREQTIAAIRSGLKHHAQTITIRFTAHTDSMDELDEIVDGLVEEALQETDDPAEGDYIRYQYGGYETRYGYETETGLFGKQTLHYTVRIIPDYYTYLSQEEEVTAEVGRILESFAFDETTTEYEKVRTIYDYVYEMVSYDQTHRRRPHYHLNTTAYSALFKHAAVCQGYCVLMYRLLREAGVSARIISGTGYLDDWEEYHSWNIVEIDGEYYNLDVTWDKTLKTTDYYLKCDEHFGEHKRDAEYMTEEFCQKYPMAKEDYSEVCAE